MKNHQMLRGSGTGLAAVIHVNTTIGFLQARDEVIDLASELTEGKTGYVWRRVFLRGRGGPRD